MPTKQIERTIENAMIKFPNAKRIAVVNFTCGYTGWGLEQALNLEQDRKAYNWNTHTVNAIKWILGARS